jgi:radical SAM/Cys-rich protein
VKPSLQSRHSPLAAPGEQLRVLAAAAVPPFAARLADAGLHPLRTTGLRVLQINVGKLCNQTCAHCHVDAGPDRRETMTRATAELCVAALAAAPSLTTVDITGGAPELNESFRFLVEQSRALGRHVIDRCNLTVLLLPSQADLADFLAAHRVQVIASLPYHRPAQTDAQRGDGVFARSIDAIRKLNALGYGEPGSGLELDLVYNPVGAFLPPRQSAIEVQFRRELQQRWGVAFNRLFTITNMPISRFLDFLVASGNDATYLQRLSGAFNPAAAAGVMCRDMVSVGFDGTLYDCDFNQMLELPVDACAPRHIRDFDAASLAARTIVTRNHCYGCTAGAGSSCGGVVVS